MKLKFHLPLIMSFLFIMESCAQNDDSPASLHRIAYQSTHDTEKKNFFLYLPAGYETDQEKNWPVMLFLHGNGERGNARDELDYVMIHGPLYEAWIQKRDLPFIIISPQLPMFGRDTMGLKYIDDRTADMIPKRLDEGVPERSPHAQPQVPMQGAVPFNDFANKDIGLPVGWDLCEEDLVHILDMVQEKYRTDVDRQYLTGLSYGGFGTWYMASRHPSRFAAIAPVVGWGHPDLMSSIAEYKIPTWAFAGGRDLVVEAQFFFGGINKLEELGHTDVRFTIHEDMSHDTWKRVYGGRDLYDWMLEQVRK